MTLAPGITAPLVSATTAQDRPADGLCRRGNGYQTEQDGQAEQGLRDQPSGPGMACLHENPPSYARSGSPRFIAIDEAEALDTTSADQAGRRLTSGSGPVVMPMVDCGY